jgi:hypothetical protein
MMTDQPINPKMQPDKKRELRRWQIADDAPGDYAYGECPHCGDPGDLVFESGLGEPELWRCESCNVEWEIDTHFAFRFGRIVPPDEF